MDGWILENPEWLWALLPAAVLVGLGAVKGGAGRGSLLLLGLAAVFAVGGAVRPSRQKVRRSPPTVVLAVDGAGLSDAGREQAATELERLIEGLDPGRARLVVLAVGETVECLRQPLSVDDVRRAVFRTASLGGPGARELSRLASLCRRAGGGKETTAVLFSDGRYGPVFSGQLPGGLVLHTRVLPSASAEDLAVLELRAPRRVRESEPFLVDVRYLANHDGEGAIELWADGKKLRSETIVFHGGDVNGVTFRDVVLPSGRHHLEARFAGPDAVTENDRADAAVTVAGRLKVLVWAAPEDRVVYKAALAAQNIDVREAGPGRADPSLLEGCDVAVLDNAGGELAASQAFLQALETFIRETGGGLLLVMGREGFTDVKFKGTPVAGLSPLTLPRARPRPKPKPGPAPDPPPPPPDPPEKDPAPPATPGLRPQPGPPDEGEEVLPVDVGTAAVVVVIDKSGSMTGDKIVLARQAALGAAEELRPGDQLGIVAFDAAPEWVMPLTPVGKLPSVGMTLRRLRAGGGTNIYPALVTAFEGLRQLDANMRHIILVSDGFNQTVEDFKGLVERMAGKGVTISCIGVGDFIDPLLLSQLTFWSKGEGGRFDYAKDFDRIPKLVLVHTRWAVTRERSPLPADPEPVPPRPDPDPPPSAVPPAGPPPVQPDEKPPEDSPETPARETEHPVRWTHPAPPVAGIEDAPPPISGLRETRARSLSDVLAETPAGLPVVASRHSGRGRTLAFAGSLAGKKGATWRSWQPLGRFLAQTVRWLASPRAHGRKPSLVYRYEDQAAVDVQVHLEDEPDPEGTPPAFLLSRRDGTRVRIVLERLCPEIYGGRAAGPFTGSLEGTLVPAQGQETRYRLNPQPHRGSNGEPDTDTLRKISALTGGRAQPPLGDLPLPPPAEFRSRQAMTLPFLVAAALLLPVAVWLRRRAGGRSKK